MTVAPKTLAQLAAAANAADRANRPTHLVALGSLVLVAGIIYALLSLNALRTSRSAVESAAYQAALIDRNIDMYNNLEVEEQSLADVYPRNAYIDSAIAQAADPYRDEFSRDPQIPSVPERRAVPGLSGVDRYTLRCSLNNDPIELTTRWITDALKEPEHLANRIFVARIALTPVNPQWRTQVSFAWYVAR